MAPTLVFSNLACKYKTRVEVNSSFKHSSFLRYNYDVLRYSSLVEYSQHFILSVTNDWAQKASMFVPGKPFPIVVAKVIVKTVVIGNNYSLG